MKIKEFKTSELIPYENNPRSNEDAIRYVANSIKEFGFKVPIIIDQNKVNVTGHTRLKAAEMLRMDKVPCIVAVDLSEEQIKAFRLADNKVSELSSWDMTKLDQELQELIDIQFNMESFGFEIAEEEMEASEDDFDFQEAVAKITEAITVKGDIYQLGNHVLMCGDATSKKDMSLLMNGDQAQMIITDPPYNVDYEGGNGKKIMNDKMADEAFRKLLHESHLRMFENIIPGGPIYVFHADSEGYNFRGAFTNSGFNLTQCLIWVKNSLVLGRQDYHWRHEPILYGWKPGEAHRWFGNRDKDTVIDDEKVNYSGMKKPELLEAIKELEAKIYDNNTVVYHDKPHVNDEHPTMKPVTLVARFIQNSSERGNIVLDSFGGSGSTLIACEEIDRKCYMMELDPVYCDVIIERWEKLTGQEAKLISG